MGLYDRDYSREQPGFHVSAPTTATMQLVLLTGAAYLAQVFLGERVDEIFALRADWFRQPWRAYQLLSYGFLHARDDVAHILINMVVLWMFGREIEQRYGRREFTVFYLVAIVFAGLAWSLSEAAYIAQQGGPAAGMVGASGGIAAVVALFALNFPHRQVLFMFFLPMPMWIAAVIGLAVDIRGAVSRSGNVAFTAHLGGALFGLAYYQFRWSLSRFVPAGRRLRWPRTKPKLRVHEPDEDDQWSEKVDAILKKIQDEGQDSLTWNERRILEKASRRYQEKRK